MISGVARTLGLSGSSMVLAALYPFWTYEWDIYLFSTGLGLILAVAIWDLVSPVHRSCPATTTEREHRYED